ncbi:TetR/AcrR family transcriptional regulator [Chelatococcus sp. GCM10030263]|uniref:TetR/AcrR family transcriptional regulator n=1 Tax=Chelatococcus sp. GCM10030263 TaxID=3273387 RepID=UPI0036236243
MKADVTTPDGLGSADARPAGLRGMQARRRKRILDAADELFARQAYADVQMDDLAQRAKVAKPTIYRYFASKEELFLETIAGVLTGVQEKLEGLAAANEDPSAVLEDAIVVLMEAFGRCAAALNALEGTDPSLGSRGRRTMRQRISALRGVVAGIVERGAAAGRFAPLDAEIAAIVILGAARLGAVRIDASRRRAGASAIADMLIHGLGARPDAVVASADPSLRKWAKR